MPVNKYKRNLQAEFSMSNGNNRLKMRLNPLKDNLNTSPLISYHQAALEKVQIRKNL
ncbi:hypothetical protein OKW21_002903 [Catalinimonas alkaloidigena]|nr:hypothetical protein [Catalinimonas alkaloidigena]